MFWVMILVFRVTLADYYSTLNVKRDATTKEIRSAFKKLALSSHPDKNKDDPDAEAKFMTINEAYEILKDEATRRKYDLYGDEGLKEDKKRQGERHSYQYYTEDFDIYGEDVEIITLSSGDFAASVENRGESVWFINYYSPRCSHCHELAPTWRKLAKELEGVVRIGAVNCQDTRDLCQNIRGYPALVLYTPNGGRQVYSGARDAESLIKHVMGALPPAPVIFIHETNFKRAISGINYPWLVSFCYQSDDCVSRSSLERVSLSLKNMVYVGAVECDDNSILCDELPTSETSGLLLFQSVDPQLRAEEILQNGVEIHSLVTQEIVFNVLKHLPGPEYVSDLQFKQLYDDAVEGKNPPQVIVLSDGSVPLEFIKLIGQLVDHELNQLDCSQYVDLCNDMFTTRFPTLFVIKEGGHERYHGRQDAADMAAFVRECIASPLVELTPKNFPAITESTAVIDFYAPWCPPCMRLLPELRAAAKEMPHMKFGSVDCTAHSQLCTQLSIKSYPTMVMYNTSKPHTTTGFKAKDDILAYIADVINPPVIDLDYSSWVLKINNKRVDEVWYVDYYAPWCGPCRQMLPVWNQFAKSIGHWQNTFVAKVDCTTNEKACQSENIGGYPTLRVYTKGSKGRGQFAQYDGWGQLNDIKGWAQNYLPSDVESLSPSNFVSRVLKARTPWLVEYYSPACAPCQRFAPELERLTSLLKDKVSVGKVNCNVHYNLCYQAKLRGYPTMYYYSGASSSQQEIIGQNIETTSADEIYKFLIRNHPYLNLARTRDEL